MLTLNPGMRRMFCLVGAIILGGVIPVIFSAARDFFDNEKGVAVNIVPPLIMLMLLSSFIDVKLKKGSTGWSLLRILIFMPVIATVAYFVLLKATGSENYAIMGFLIGMTPTATSAPVITGLLNKRADYVTVATVATNLFTAFALAPLTAIVVGGRVEINTPALALKTILLIGVPFLLAVIFRNFAKPVAEFIRRHKRFSFYLWMIMLFTVCAQSSAYICKQEDLSHAILLQILGLAAVMCVINFVAGFALGEAKFRRECSQALGQKNTMLMLWVGLAFFNPIVALGPTFYVVCHNLWNSWQLRVADKNATTVA